MSEQLREQLMKQEGWSARVYKDKNGYLTIGFGHLIDFTRGGTISQRVGRLILDDDIFEKRKEVDKNWPWAQEMEQARYDAMINMAFQMGISGLGTFKRFLGHAQNGDYMEAAKEMLDSKWARNHPARAMTLAQQMRTGEYFRVEVV